MRYNRLFLFLSLLYFLYFLSLLIILLYYSLQLNTFQWILVRFLLRAFAFRGIFLNGENLPSKSDAADDYHLCLSISYRAKNY